MKFVLMAKLHMPCGLHVHVFTINPTRHMQIECARQGVSMDTCKRERKRVYERYKERGREGGRREGVRGIDARAASILPRLGLYSQDFDAFFPPKHDNRVG